MPTLSITKAEAEALFDGILAGDGDIYGRMVDREGAKPPYPLFVGAIAPLLYESLDPESELYGKGQAIADDFLESNTFADEDIGGNNQSIPSENQSPP
jgi:hypothetical protein